MQASRQTGRTQLQTVVYYQGPALKDPTQIGNTAPVLLWRESVFSFFMMIIKKKP